MESRSERGRGGAYSDMRTTAHRSLFQINKISRGICVFTQCFPCKIPVAEDAPLAFDRHHYSRRSRGKHNPAPLDAPYSGTVERKQIGDIEGIARIQTKFFSGLQNF